MFKKAIMATSVLVAFSAHAEDTVQCAPSPNRATVKCIVVPDSDGAFIFEFVASAVGNGHGTPTISTRIDVDGKECAPKESSGWKDGRNEVTALCTKQLKGGQAYTATASSGNSNAAAESAELRVKRAGK